MEIEKNGMEATLAELVKFENSARWYKEKYPKERSRLTFALTKQIERYKDKRENLGKSLSLEMDAIRSRHASVDDKENIMEEKFDVKQGKGEDNTIIRMKYKKDAKQKMEEEIDKLTKSYESKTLEIKPPYANEPFFLEVPKNFDFDFIEPFKKFIFNPEMTEEQELELYLAQKPEEQKPTIAPVLNGQ